MGKVEKVVESDLCTGCGLCASLSEKKIEMQLNTAGYLRPVVGTQLTASQEQVVAQVCPGVGLKHQEIEAPYHPIWGPIVETLTGYATNPVVRHAGSSGGAISALLIYMIEKKIVDYVLHIGVSATNPLENEIKLSTSAEEVVKYAGSRYSPSAPLNNIDDMLSKEGRFAFVGKPCDVATLRQYARVNPLVREKIPVMLAFMCAGIPSIEGTYAILKKMGVEKRDVKSFVYRGNGWPGMTKVEKHNGESFEIDYATSWGTILNRHLQHRCKICPDGIGEFADIVCADAWYGKDGYPDFTEQDGRSLIITRTNKGASLLKNSVDDGYVVTQPLPVEDIALMQPYQENRKQMIFARVVALKLFGKMTPQYINFGLYKTAILGGIKGNLRNFIGMVRRQIQINKH